MGKNLKAETLLTPGGALNYVPGRFFVLGDTVTDNAAIDANEQVAYLRDAKGVSFELVGESMRNLALFFCASIFAT